MKEGILKEGLVHLHHNMINYWTFLWLGIFLIFLGLILENVFLYGLGVIIILGSVLKPKKSKENKNETSETVKIRNLDPSEVDLLKTIFEQNWIHARHVENERMWFTNIYAAIIAGTLGLLAKNLNAKNLNSDTTTISLIMVVILFLILFSIIGTLVIFKLNIEYHNFITHSKIIPKKLDLDKYMASPLGGLIKRRKFEARLIPVATLFLLFYTLSLSGLCALSILICFKNASFAAVLVFLVLFIFLFVILYWYQDTIMNRIDKSVNGNDKARN